jgi:hypothetical protein
MAKNRVVAVPSASIWEMSDEAFVRERFGNAADGIFAAYPAKTDGDVRYAVNRLGTNSGILLHAHVKRHQYSGDIGWRDHASRPL